MEPVGIGRLQQHLERLDRRERILELHQLARGYARGGYARTDALEVAHGLQLLAERLGELPFAREQLHDVEPLVDARQLLDGHGHPPLEQTAAHGGQRPVDDVGKALLRPAAPLVEKSSRLRMVNLSIQT